MFTTALSLIFLITLSEAIAQSCLKQARADTSHCNELIGVGLVAYFIVAILLFKTYRFEDLGHTNLVWSCLSIIVAFLVGTIFFHEVVNGFAILSIALACAAIACAHLSRKTVPT